MSWNKKYSKKEYKKFKKGSKKVNWGKSLTNKKITKHKKFKISGYAYLN